MIHDIAQTLAIYEIPSQAVWRALELDKLRKLKGQLGFYDPVLEIGCGDGGFSGLIFSRIKDGIDINYRVIERCKQKANIYEKLHCMDARFMSFPSGSYQTVFANCVIEHIPDVIDVLRSAYRVLAPHGKFVVTVPLKEMNNHLLLNAKWYGRLRRRHLAHINLLTQEQWEKLFLSAGFSKIISLPLLAEKQCYLWDILDAPVCLGWKRYKVSAVIRLLISLFSDDLREDLNLYIAKLLARRFEAVAGGVPCALAIVAEK